MKKITGNCNSPGSINVKQLILLIYCLSTRGKNISFANGKRLLISHLCFDSELFITFLVGIFLRAVGRKRIFFYLIDLLSVLVPTYMRNLKTICQGSV